MKILLLSAYDADSHQYWRTGLVSHFPEHQWTVLTLPGRYFSWRIRGNSMSWAFGEQSAVISAQYDLIIATSMTDLSALKGFIPSLANTPSLVYFHENQFSYPSTHKARANVEPQILNLYTALAATRVVFNSHYNFQTFIDGLTLLLKKLPDQVPANTIELLKQKSSVLAVPLSIDKTLHTAVLWDKYQDIKIANRSILISWASRWEYDKGPDHLLALVERLEQQNIDYRLCIMGQKFRQEPKEFELLKTRFSHRIDHFGYAKSKAEYLSWLRQSDFFLSTAVHEFQGLSVLEAVQLGCTPILPNRLVYPELFDGSFLYNESSDLKIEAHNAIQLILDHKEVMQSGSESLINIDFSWEKLKPLYEHEIHKALIDF